MGGNTLNFTPISFLLPLLILLLSVPIGSLGDACDKIDCGNGNCTLDDSSIIGYNCVCDSGWKKVQIAVVTFPACVLPNCSVDVNCGGPPPPPPPPPLDPFGPCNILTVCGDGTCVVNGTEHFCQCNQGAFNLLNNTAFPCIKACAIGIDCDGFKLGSPAPPSPPVNGTLSPPPPSESPPNGSSKISKAWKSNDNFGMILVFALVMMVVM